MDSFGLIALLSVLATLAAVAALGGTALLVGAYASQRAKLQASEQRAETLSDALSEAENDLAVAESELKKFKRARRNKLYQGSMEQYGFAAQQTIIRLRALRAEFDQECNVMEKMLDLSKE